MSSSLIQRSFAAGEIAPALYARADQTKFQTGLRTCRNFLVMRHGGVTNRSGLKHIAEVKTSSLATYFLKFVFNDSQTYVLEIGNLYMRFYRAGARIVVSGVAAYNGGTAYVIGSLVVSSAVNYYCIQAGTGHTPVSSPTYWYPLTGVIYEIPTPYLTADLLTLQFVQSGDIVTIVHPSYDPLELARTGHTTWVLSTVTLAPSIVAPGSMANDGGGAGTAADWVVTSVKQDSFEESLQSVATTSVAAPTSGAPLTVSWVAVTGAQEYNVYKKDNGIYGYIGSAGGVSFIDRGILADTSTSPPIARNPFSGTNNHPSTVAYYQQRLMFANTNNDPEMVQASKSGMFKNFTISSPLQDDDAVAFTIAGNEVQEVRHMIGLKRLMVLTAGGEWLIQGDTDGALSPTAINPDQQGYNGASEVKPVVVGNSLVYTQARGSIVRDLRFEQQADGYQGKDLTIFSAHLFAGYTLTRMAYAQIPHSIVWITRSDGTLIGLTYMREQEVWGWHRHDTDGTFEDVCTVPEGDEDGVYVIVKRTINGVVKRYVERFASRRVTDITVDALFLDSFLSYDGRNASAIALDTLAISGWTVNDTINIIAASNYFVAGDVGNALILRAGTDEVRVVIVSYTSATVVVARPTQNVPPALQGPIGTTDWDKAVDELAGLDHLEGKAVSVLADGNVVANPNNPDFTLMTVSAGRLTLDRPYTVIHVGLPITADFETLGLDVAGQEFRDKKKIITSVSLLVDESRGVFAGPDADNLTEHKPDAIDNYGDPIALMSGIIELPITGSWGPDGRVLIRQIDPLPLTILSVIPNGNIGG